MHTETRSTADLRIKNTFIIRHRSDEDLDRERFLGRQFQRRDVDVIVLTVELQGEVPSGRIADRFVEDLQIRFRLPQARDAVRGAG